jgi:hypothetical protein
VLLAGKDELSRVFVVRKNSTTYGSEAIAILMMLSYVSYPITSHLGETGLSVSYR